jgi:hypothetical protein
MRQVMTSLGFEETYEFKIGQTYLSRTGVSYVFVGKSDATIRNLLFRGPDGETTSRFKDGKYAAFGVQTPMDILPMDILPGKRAVASEQTSTAPAKKFVKARVSQAIVRERRLDAPIRLSNDFYISLEHAKRSNKSLDVIAWPAYSTIEVEIEVEPKGVKNGK